MIEKLRQKIFTFIYSPKGAPLLAGFAVGWYMILYYYSKNFDLANSLQQFLFFTAYYMLLPMVVFYAGFKVFSRIKNTKFKEQFLFIAIPLVTCFYLLQLSYIGVSKRFLFVALIFVITALSFKLKRYYKLFILLLFFLSLFNLPPVIQVGYMAATANNSWKQQPDDIANIVFKQRPNIYYIQPDGYTGFNNLKDANHNFDNSVFEDFLKLKGFVLYRDFRSNYYSTLLSNSSMFSMKHHYVPEDVEAYAARSIIMGTNPVLQIFKNNNYKTHFISQKPYLLVNRPFSNYDYCNFNDSELPYLKDGWSIDKKITPDIEHSVSTQLATGNFYFIEKFSPGHIHGLKVYSNGVESERKLYLKELEVANAWLTHTIKYIEENDPNALIIIGADHGGFVGFEYTEQSETYTKNKLLVKSVFGVAMAIKWNNSEYREYDAQLKTSVNLFRTLFSFLAKDKKYLNNLQEDASYIKMRNPHGLYKYIDKKGNVVFDKKE